MWALWGTAVPVLTATGCMVVRFQQGMVQYGYRTRISVVRDAYRSEYEYEHFVDVHCELGRS
eukprot:scaffold144487_cov23-Prasinocladus_malaysianus.AAC.1